MTSSSDSSRLSRKGVPRIHIVGRKNAGKTTLVCELVRELTGRGLRVATVKHTHHHHELDTPGKDSHRHREAGAAGVGILSPEMTAAFVPVQRTDQPRGYEPFTTMFADADLILVEGDLNADAPRVEVWRSILEEPPYAAGDQSIAAVVTDDQISLDVPQWSRMDLRTLADQVCRLAQTGPASVE